MTFLIILIANKDIKSFIYLLFFHSLVGVSHTFLSSSFSLYHTATFSYLIIPSLLISISEIFNPIIKLKNKTDNIFNYIVSLTFCCTFLTTILTQYITGFSYTKPIYETFDHLLLWLTTAIQGKLFIINLKNNKGLINRLKSIIESYWICIIDIIFLLILVTLINFKINVYFEFLFFIYGFRLVRILLFIPYFDEVWESIKRGLRLTGNYISSFLVILVLLSINSRILFSKSNTNFTTIPSSIFTNFKIILGNGFDLFLSINENLLLVSYIFFVTLIIGIIFTSTITALITDSLLLKKTNTVENKKSFIWYKRQLDEGSFEYILRIVNKIAFI